jgi:hypothetical protein
MPNKIIDMKKNMLFASALFQLLFLFSCQQTTTTTDVLVIGGGTGGTAAGIQAARLGASTLIAEPTEWLGGMLTAAGVSATDGNHAMPAGIWGEFRQKIWNHYGGPDKVETGWVSNTQFEPKVGAGILAEMAAAEPKLEVWFNTSFISAEKTPEGWKVRLAKEGKEQLIHCRILVDGTDLGDVAASVGCQYDLGMDARADSGEFMAPEQANDIIQDFTWCAVLKDYGPDADKTIPKPEGYDPAMFRCCCNPDPQGNPEPCPGEKPHPCETMLTYAKLPGEKYLINWPLHGNDYYANMVEMTEVQRQAVYEEAKKKTLQFVYYIQTELGHKHLGLADDEFPTADQLPLIPYHREGRRINGLARLDVNHVLDPHRQQLPLYRTGIAVGDYPIDHHHKENLAAPEIEFPPVPSFNIPVGCLIPDNVDHLLMADKAISVTNIVNGSSRLQPVILQVGQAAGIMAALAASRKTSPRNLQVREIQAEMLKAKGYLMPFFDVAPDHPQFEAIQRVAAAGLMQGKGEPYQWANRTWFYPDSLANLDALPAGLNIDKSKTWTRKELAAEIDRVLKPFETPVGFDGHTVK